MINTKGNYSSLNIWNHLTVCKQISSHLEIKLPTNYGLLNHRYNHLIVYKQMSSDSFKNVFKNYAFTKHIQ